MFKCYNIQIFSLSIILFCLFASSKASINFRKLESTSKITLKIKEIGMQFILNESFRPLPNKILVKILSGSYMTIFNLRHVINYIR